MKNKLLLTILLTFLHYFSFGQVLTQTVRGTVVDMISQAPLPGATVVVQAQDFSQACSISMPFSSRVSQMDTPFWASMTAPSGQSSTWGRTISWG